MTFIVFVASTAASALFVRLKSNISPFFAPLGNSATGHSRTWWQSETNWAKPALTSEMYNFVTLVFSVPFCNVEVVDNAFSCCRAVGGGARLLLPSLVSGGVVRVGKTFVGLGAALLLISCLFSVVVVTLLQISVCFVGAIAACWVVNGLIVERLGVFSYG